MCSPPYLPTPVSPFHGEPVQPPAVEVSTADSRFASTRYIELLTYYDQVRIILEHANPDSLDGLGVL